MKKSFLKIFSGNKYILLSNVAERIFFFLVFLIIARKFSSEQYGELITVFSLANIFIILFDFGLPLFLQREISQRSKNPENYFSAVIIISFISFPVYVSLVTIYCGLMFSDIASSTIILVSLAVYSFSLCNVINKALSGLNLFRSQFISLIASRSLVLILILPLLFLTDTDLNTILLILLSGAIIQLTALFVQANRNKLTLSISGFNFSGALKILNFSLPLGLAVVFNFLYDKIDIIIISKLLGYSEAAFYNIGYGLFKTTAIAYSFLFVSGFTRISFLARNKKAITLFLKKYLSILSWICLAVSVFLFITADILVDIIYTERYSSSADILRILSLATFGLAFNNLTGIVLNGIGLFRKNMIITLIGLIINVILNIIFIPQYGIKAAAVITVLTEYFIFAGGFYFIRQHIKH